MKRSKKCLQIIDYCKSYIYGLLNIIEKPRKDWWNIDRNKGLASRAIEDKKTGKKSFIYLYDGEEISKEVYDQYLDEIRKERTLKAVTYFKDRISSERLIRDYFDINKLTVSDYDRCIDRLSEASYNTAKFYDVLKQIEEDYKYACIHD